MKRDSIRLITDLVLVTALGSLGFSIAIFWLIRNSLVQPLHRVTRRIARFEETGEAIEMPEFRTAEMRKLSQAIERACQAKAAAR
jgi:methyl-accepting chemotaxis protein